MAKSYVKQRNSYVLILKYEFDIRHLKPACGAEAPRRDEGPKPETFPRLCWVFMSNGYETR
jgi:hypothetical protein